MHDVDRQASGGHKEAARRPRAAPVPARRLWAAALGLVVLTAMPTGAPAQIYRYQDDFGVWHFTDNPPPGARADVVPGITTGTAREPERRVRDLARKLQADHPPTSALSAAALTVVAVRTPHGDGSGFFCSEDGHVLTSRRLVRPSEGAPFAERDREVREQEGRLRELEAQLASGREQLARMEKDLAGYQRVIEGARDGTTREWAQQAHARLSERYEAHRAEVDAAQRTLARIRGNLRKSRRDIDWQRSVEAVQTRFALVLRDGTELDAALVATGTEADVALLKADNVRVPFLRTPTGPPPSPGTTVFALGGSAGAPQPVSAGSITGITTDAIHTDVRLPSAFTGGPLVTENARLLGISRADGAEGATGSAVPLGTALAELPPGCAGGQ